MNKKELENLLWECAKEIPFSQNVKESEMSFAVDSLKRNLEGIDFNDKETLSEVHTALQKSIIMYFEFENEIMTDIVEVIKEKFYK